MNPIQIDGTQVRYDGKAVRIFARESGHFMNLLAKGQDLKPWIDWNRKLGFNTLKVYAEQHAPRGLWAEKPTLLGIWPISQLKRGNRPTSLNMKNLNLLAGLYEISHETRMAFIYTIDATLHRIEGISSGMIGHCISRTMEEARELANSYPLAKIIFNYHHAWDDAWNAGSDDPKRIKLGKWELGMQAGRCRRWVRMVNGNKVTMMSFEKPGGAGWEPEQYPEAVIMCEGKVGRPTYPVGKGVKQFPIHAYKVNELVARGRSKTVPTLISETPLKRIPDSEFETWIPAYKQFLSQCERLGIGLVVTDAKGIRTDVTEAVTPLEEFLLGKPIEPPLEWRTITEWVWGGQHYRLQGKV